MKVALIHPFKHHAYYAMKGLILHNPDSQLYVGYFNNGDWLDKLIGITSYRELANGYYDPDIVHNVKTNKLIKILFLLNKKWPGVFHKLYDKVFQYWCIRNLREFDCIYVLQDYCNDVIREARKLGIKIIYDQILAYNSERYTCENVPQIPSDKLFLQVENLLMANAIIVPSDFVKESLTGYEFSHQISDKLKLIHYGGDVDGYLYQNRSYRKQNQLNLLCVAKLSKRKGITYLLTSMNNLQHYNVKLTIVGSGKDSDGAELISQIMKMRNVEYLGTIPHIQMKNLYKNYDVFVLVSLAEGSSLSIFEALASGMPCIVTNNTGSIVEDGRDGFIVDAKSSKAIEEAIIRFINCPDLVSKMSYCARKNAEKHTWKLFANEISMLCGKLEDGDADG